MWGDGLAAIGLPQNTGFTLEVFPKGEEGGTLVNLGQGGQTLTYSDLRFTYTVRTATDTFSVTSAAIFPSRWHQVSARYHNGKLELWVNQTRYEQAATGAVVYNWTGNASGNDNAGANHDLEIAGEFSGYLDNLKWYNWSSSPVMTFAGGVTEMTVTVDATKKATLNLMSTGKLHEHGGVLGLHRVAVHTDKVHQYVSLVSLDNYKVIAGMYSETRPLSEQIVQLPMGFIFPSAHAGAGDTAMSILSFFFPVQELGIVFQQLAYAVTDPDKFEGDTFIVNLIVAATYLPPGRVLQPFAKSLGILFKTLKGINPKFLKYFGGMFSGIVSKAKKGDFDTLWHMIPFFIVLAEMYNDDEARKGLEFMFQTVDSGEDILSWVDYLALPASGWDGDGAIPEVGLLDTTEQKLPLSWMMNSAYAATKLPRIDGTALGKVLATVAKKVSGEEAKALPDALKVLREGLSGPGSKEITKYLFKVGTLKASVFLFLKAGKNSLLGFAKGKGNARYSFPVILSTVGYLGYEITCGALVRGGDTAKANELECGDENKVLNEQVSFQIASKLNAVLADASTGSTMEEESANDDEEMALISGGKGHGALFHLVQTAYFQLKHRYGSGLPIKFMEKARYVTIADENVDDGVNLDVVCKTKDEHCKFKYQRNVDIILGEGTVQKDNSGYYSDDGVSEPETWIELKSWAAKGESGSQRYEFANETDFLAGKKVAWKIGENAPRTTPKTNFTAHKQFSLDRAAAKVEYAFLTQAEGRNGKNFVRQKVSSDFKWRFQSFIYKAKTGTTRQVSPKLGSPSIKSSFGDLVSKRPDVSGGVAEQRKIQNYSFGADSAQYKNAELSSVRKDMTALLVQAGFEEIKDALDEDAGE